MELKVTIKTIYGEQRIYPACPKSEALASIAGTKTLTEETIAQAKKLGFTFAVCSPAFL